jgi:acyl carrier protein
MNESELKDIIVAELAKIALGSDPAALDLDDNLREGLDIDSFDALNFFIALSERLHIDISEKDLGKLNTMCEILHYLQVKSLSIRVVLTRSLARPVLSGVASKDLAFVSLYVVTTFSFNLVNKSD